jgi:lactate permease
MKIRRPPDEPDPYFSRFVSFHGSNSSSNLGSLTWTQNYTPLGNSLAASTLVTGAPIVVLLGLLAFFRVHAHWAALTGLLVVLVAAVFVYRMPPQMALAAGAYGAM